MNVQTIEDLRKSLLTVKEYCDLTRVCVASAYKDFQSVPGLAWKRGRTTVVDRDVALQKVASLKPWFPSKERPAA